MAYRVHLDLTDYPEVPQEMPYSITVEWGDGLTSEFLQLTTPPDLTHDYEDAGTYYVVFTLINACGRQQRRLEITLQAGYGDDVLNVFERTFPLVIHNIKTDKACETLPSNTQITGEVQEFLLPSGEYGYETVITSNVELIQFPKNYELIPLEEVFLGGDDPASNLDVNTTENLHFIVSEVKRDEPAILHGDYSFSLVFDFMDMYDEDELRSVSYRIQNYDALKLWYNVYTVTFTADAAFFARWSCAEAAVAAMIDNGDGTFTATLDFEGRHIAGFQLEMAQGQDAHVYQVVINVLQNDGSISPLSINYLDFYAVSFITNKQALLNPDTPVISTVSGVSAGHIPLVSTLPISHVEILCDDALKARILHDSSKIMHGQHLLTVKNTSDNSLEMKIPVTLPPDNSTTAGRIFYIQAYRVVPPSIENLPIVFRTDINANRIHNTYFYKQTADDTVLTVQDSFSTRLEAFVGTGTLQTIYGEILFDFYNEL